MLTRPSYIYGGFRKYSAWHTCIWSVSSILPGRSFQTQTIRLDEERLWTAIFRCLHQASAALSWHCPALSCCCSERWTFKWPVWGHVYSGISFLHASLCIWLHSFFHQLWPISPWRSIRATTTRMSLLSWWALPESPQTLRVLYLLYAYQ